MALVLVALAGAGLGVPARAQLLNDWRVACGADKGAVRKEGADWHFAPSRDFCPGSGGSIRDGQRSEITTRKVKATTRGAWLFSTMLTFRSGRFEPFDLFRISDGRKGCTAPLKVNVTENGQMRFVSGVPEPKTRGCVTRVTTLAPSERVIRRDGTEHLLEILVNFDGHGGFETTLYLDGRQELYGVYVPGDPEPPRSQTFSFRHGVYAREAFDFSMVSRGLSVREVRPD